MNFFRRYGLDVMDKTISVKMVLILALLAVAAVSALGYFAIGSTPLYDAATMWITLALCAFLLGVLIKGNEALFPMSALLTFFLLLFVFTRVLSFLYLPGRVALPLSVFLSAQQINSGYTYIALGVAALALGFYLALRLFKNIASNTDAPLEPIKEYPSAHLAIVLLVSCVAQLYITLWLGSSVLGDVYYGVKHPVVGILAVLLSVPWALAIAAISLFASRKQGVVSDWRFFLFALAFMLTTVMLGSRSGGIWVLEVALVAMLVLQGNFRERLRTYLGFMLAIALMSVISFPVATAVRTALIAERDAIAASASASASASAPAPAPAPAPEGGMLSRLGAPFDTSIMTIAIEPDHEMLARTMNLPYALKSAVNVIVPGVIFDEAQINTALLWPFIYKLRDSKLLQRGYYESFIWAAWGTTYAMFGWGGGIAALLVMGFVLQAAYMAISRWGGGLSSYFSVWFLLNVWSFYSAMGLDDWLVGLQRSLFSMLLILIMLWSLNRLARLRIFARLGNDA